MPDSLDLFDESPGRGPLDMEQLIRSAGDYMEVSSELRASVVATAVHEAHRDECSKWLAMLCLFALFVAAFVYYPLRNRAQSRQAESITTICRIDPLRADSRQILRFAKSLDQENTEWGLVRAFCKANDRRRDIFCRAL